MDNIQDIFVLLNMVTQQEQEGRVITVSQYNELLDYANNSVFNKYLKLYEAGISDDKMSIFKVSLSNEALTASKWTKPISSDIYARYSSFTTTATPGIPIEVIPNNKLAGRLSHSIMTPTTSRPICSIYDTYIEFFPTITNADIVYLKYPDIPLYVEKSTSGFAEYDSAASTQLEWPKIAWEEIILEMLANLGLRLTREQLTAYADKLNKEK